MRKSRQLSAKQMACLAVIVATGILVAVTCPSTRNWEPIGVPSMEPFSSSPGDTPYLTFPSVSSTTGTATTPFSFSVVYTNVDNTAPVYMYIYIDGQGYPMSQQDPADLQYLDGCVFMYITTLRPGCHWYSFSVCVGTTFFSTPIYYAPLVQDEPPTLTYCAVSPTAGDAGTTFTYSVMYTDLEGAEPVYVQAWINGQEYSMTKQDPLDMNFRDGCIYYVHVMTLSNGSCSYYFKMSDGYHVVTSETSRGPNLLASLTSGSVTPTSGNYTTLFTFEVTYVHKLDVPPMYVQVW
ncbi:MAG: hypothetical protein GYA24_16625, partial [Candidatus Lokiarchaeota archaeon]|nr:hypothetical protein [Candidatus Lokiarchaeota archaeon]